MDADLRDHARRLRNPRATAHPRRPRRTPVAAVVPGRLQTTTACIKRRLVKEWDMFRLSIVRIPLNLGLNSVRHGTAQDLWGAVLESSVDLLLL